MRPKAYLHIPLWWPDSQAWRRLARLLVPNPGTLIILAVFLLAQSAGALPFRALELAGNSTTTISYQGRLADSAGNPITTSGIGMQFCLYDTDVGGSPVDGWCENHTAVPVEDGLFQVLLGSINPIPVSTLASHSTLWLGISVGSDSEMTPRERIASVPYAMIASTVADGSITTEKLADGAVTSAKLAGHGPGMIRSWEDNATKLFDATGSAADRILLDTGIDVTVASGETKYYLVVYEGAFNYWSEDRTGTQAGFYGGWSAKLVDGGTVLGTAGIVQTGYRMRWDAVGADVYWYHPFVTVWLVQLDAGVHSLDIAIWGYSDGTMQKGRVSNQKLTAIPLS